MTDESIDGEAIAERRHLVSLAFRMLGTIAEAEDAVQETYVRWYRLSDQERASIDSPRAWLTRAASRVCLDLLGSARARRESYIGEWLPEPVPATAFGAPYEPASSDARDPLDRVSLDESVSTALLTVLESMTPAERVVFVLHEVFAVPFREIAEVVGRTDAACRQLAASARRRVRSAAARRVSREEHDRVVLAFAAAAQSGRLDELIAVLDPEVVLRSDGGGHVSAARRPVIGADRVARFLLGIGQKRPEVQLHPLQTPDGLGFAMWLDARVVGVVILEVGATSVREVRLVLNPEKLSLWN